jgi:hypothetical protein
MTPEELQKEFKYGLVAVTQSEEDAAQGQVSIVHFCGYPNPPTQVDIDSLVEELNTDPTFNLVGRMGKDVFVVTATPEMVAHYVGNITLIDHD